MRSPEPGATTPRHWVAVASAEHVALGRRLGFMQVGHGKEALLSRLHGGDRIAYYSPVRVFGAKEACQAFTAVGRVRDERIYVGDMTEHGQPDFKPYRRDVDWFDAREAPIRPLLGALGFTQGRASWGSALRFGLLQVSADDMALIMRAMHALVMTTPPTPSPDA